MTTLILSLSDDLLIEILRLLHYLCLVKSSETCRALYRIIRTSSSLKLLVELGKDGLICLRQDLSSKDLMSALEDLRGRWDTLDFKPNSTLTYTGPVSVFNGTYKSGIFVSPQYYDDATRITWFDMGDFTHRSVNLSYPTQPECFAIDPGQDLLVSIEFRGDRPSSVDFWDNMEWETYLHFTEMTTAGAHPAARLPSVKLDIPILDRMVMNDIAQLDLMDIKIVDRAVVWSIRHFPRHDSYRQVVIYNWQQGICVYDSGRDFDDQRRDEFQLISDAIFVVTTKDKGNCAELLVYSFDIAPDPDIQERPRLLYVLALPEHLPDVKLNYTCLTYEYSSSHRPCLANDTFLCSSDEQLLLLRMSYHKKPCDDCSSLYVPFTCLFLYELVIPTRVIHQLAREAFEMNVQTGKMYLTWNEWGPRSTRFLAPDDADVSELRGLVGQKLLRAVERHENELQSSWYFRTLEFSRRQREAKSTETTQAWYHGQNDPTRLAAGPASPFAEDVVTCLPYYEVMRRVPNPKAGIHWKYDHNAFIGVETVDDNNADDTLITVKLTMYKF